MLFSRVALTYLTAAAWRLSKYRTECRGDLDCCSVGRCTPNHLYYDTYGNCFKNADSHCIFDIIGRGTGFIDSLGDGKAQDGCGGRTQGELIIALPSEFSDARYEWASGNFTIGPLDKYNIEPCYSTDWFMQFVQWPGASCDSAKTYLDDDVIKVTNVIRYGPMYDFRSPTSFLPEQDELVNNYLTFDVAPLLSHPTATAIRILTSNPDCRLIPVVSVANIDSLGQQHLAILPGKAQAQRVIHAHLVGKVHGLKGTYQAFTAPVDIE